MNDHDLTLPADSPNARAHYYGLPVDPLDQGEPDGDPEHDDADDPLRCCHLPGVCDCGTGLPDDADRVYGLPDNADNPCAQDPDWLPF
jgi:hypothetical protein